MNGLATLYFDGWDDHLFSNGVGMMRNGLSIFGLQKEMVLSIAKMELECLDL